MELGEDAPPEEIWLDDDALEAHFDGLRTRHESTASGEAIEQAPMDDNYNDEIAKWRK